MAERQISASYYDSNALCGHLAQSVLTHFARLAVATQDCFMQNILIYQYQGV